MLDLKNHDSNLAKLSIIASSTFPLKKKLQNQNKKYVILDSLMWDPMPDHNSKWAFGVYFICFLEILKLTPF